MTDKDLGRGQVTAWPSSLKQLSFPTLQLPVYNHFREVLLMPWFRRMDSLLESVGVLENILLVLTRK